jgi:hypothetical protein
MPSGNPNMGTNTTKSTNFNGGTSSSSSLGVSSGKMQSTASPVKDNTGKSGPAVGTQGGNSGKTDTAAPSAAKAAPAKGPTTGPASIGGSFAGALAAGKSPGLYAAVKDATRAELDARAKAVSRGPGPLEGTQPGNPFGKGRAAEAQRQALTSLGLSQAERNKLPTDKARELVNNMTRVSVGESLPNAPQNDLNAVARVMQNRLDLYTANNVERYAPDRLLAGFDAAGVRPGTKQTGTFKTTLPGTDAYARGLKAVAEGMSTYGDFAQTAPQAVLDATHYLNEKSTTARQQANAGLTPATPRTQYGPHTFFNPIDETSPKSMQIARNDVLNAPNPLTVASPAPKPAPETTKTAGYVPANKQPQAPMTLVSPEPVPPEQEQPDVELDALVADAKKKGLNVEKLMKEYGYTELRTDKGLMKNMIKSELAKRGFPSGVSRVYVTKDGRVGISMKSNMLSGLDNVATPKQQVADNAPVAPNTLFSEPKGAKVTVAGRPDVPVSPNTFNSKPAPAKRDFTGPLLDRSKAATFSQNAQAHLLNERLDRVKAPARQQTTVAGRPDVPVADNTYRSGKSPLGPFTKTTIAGRPDVPVSQNVTPFSKSKQAPLLERAKQATRANQIMAHLLTERLDRMKAPPVDIGARPSLSPKGRPFLPSVEYGTTDIGARKVSPPTRVSLAEAARKLIEQKKVEPEAVETVEKTLGDPTVITQLGMKPPTEPKAFLARVIADVRRNSGSGKETAGYLIERIANDPKLAAGDTSLFDITSADAWYAWLLSQYA